MNHKKQMPEATSNLKWEFSRNRGCHTADPYGIWRNNHPLFIIKTCTPLGFVRRPEYGHDLYHFGNKIAHHRDVAFLKNKAEEIYTKAKAKPAPRQKFRKDLEPTTDHPELWIMAAEADLLDEVTRQMIQQGMTMEELAAKSGLSVAKIKTTLVQLRLATIDDLARIALALRCTITSSFLPIKNTIANETDKVRNSGR